MGNQMNNDELRSRGENPLYLILPVQPALQDWVESILITNWNAAEYSIDPVYIYPWSVTTHIFFTLCDEPLPELSSSDDSVLRPAPNFIVGPRLNTKTENMGFRRRAVGIAFKPSGLKRILDIPVSELVNSNLDASLVFGNEINEVADRLKNAKNNAEILAIIERFLIEKSEDPKLAPPFDRAVTELIMHSGNLPIKIVADYAGVSTRQLERKFAENLGVSPKLFAKIIRFTNACVHKEAHPELPWCRIAYEFGYADQMHLIHDFKMFSGLAPSAIDRRIKESISKLVTAIEGRI